MIGIAIVYSFAAMTLALCITSFGPGPQLIAFSRNRHIHIEEAIGLAFVDGAVIYGVIRFLKVYGVYPQPQNEGQKNTEDEALSGS